MKLIACMVGLSLMAWAASPEAEVGAAMDALTTATMTKDRAALEKLLHPQLSYSHSNAKMEDKAAMIAAVMEPERKYNSMKRSETTFRTVGSMVLVQTKMQVDTVNAQGHQLIPLSLLMVWTRSGKDWQLIARQATRLP